MAFPLVLYSEAVIEIVTMETKYSVSPSPLMGIENQLHFSFCVEVVGNAIWTSFSRGRLPVQNGEEKVNVTGLGLVLNVDEGNVALADQYHLALPGAADGETRGILIVGDDELPDCSWILQKIRDCGCDHDRGEKILGESFVD